MNYFLETQNFAIKTLVPKKRNEKWWIQIGIKGFISTTLLISNCSVFDGLLAHIFGIRTRIQALQKYKRQNKNNRYRQVKVPQRLRFLFLLLLIFADSTVVQEIQNLHFSGRKNTTSGLWNKNVVFKLSSHCFQLSTIDTIGPGCLYLLYRVSSVCTS